MKAEVDIPRLCIAMQRSRLALRRQREERREAVRLSVGNHWAEEGARQKQPVNLLALYVEIMQSQLVAKSPRVMLSTFERNLKPAVKAMEAWANREIERTRLANTLQRVVVDALFSVGICKVALATPAESAAAAWNLRAGQPFAERVDLDDFVYDIHARDFSEVGYIGHRYRVPLAAVKDSKIYSKERKELTSSLDALYNLEGDERISVLGRGFYSDADEFEDMVDLWEVYVPRHRLIFTLADDYLTGPSQGMARPLRVQRWLGPDRGPYHILSFGCVPGNAMPKAPIQDLVDLHEGTNRAYRKMMRMIDRIKVNMAVGGGSLEDAERWQKANDGDAVQCGNPDMLKPIVWGGEAIQIIQAMCLELKQQFDYFAGNLATLGGLAPEASTLGQEKMLNQNASRTVQDKQDRVVEFTAQVLSGLCWYWWHDPFKVMKSRHSVPGSIEIIRQVTPAMRAAGDFEELDISVDPYSLQRQTPTQRMATIEGFVKNLFAPMAQLFQSQGVVLDLNKLVQLIASYNDMPDLAELITMQEPPMPDATGGGGAPGGPAGASPPETTRNYVRQSMPTQTQKGNDRNLITTLLGGNPGGNPNGQPVNGAAR